MKQIYQSLVMNLKQLSSLFSIFIQIIILLNN